MAIGLPLAPRFMDLAIEAGRPSLNMFVIPARGSKLEVQKTGQVPETDSGML
jgi:hypothetical protein